MGQKYKRFREFRTPFSLRDIRKNPRSMYARVPQAMAAICSKNRKIVPYHGASPNTRNGARLRSPSPIMAPGPRASQGLRSPSPIMAPDIVFGVCCLCCLNRFLLVGQRAPACTFDHLFVRLPCLCLGVYLLCTRLSKHFSQVLLFVQGTSVCYLNSY